MNAKTIEAAIEAERRNAEALVLRYGQRLSDLPRIEALLRQLAELPSAGDVGSVSICGDYMHDERAEVDLFLLKKDSTLPREVVKALSIRLGKTPGGDAITCKGKVDGISLHIYGYLPETCAIVYETVTVPERLERRPRVVCAGNGQVAP